ncbi:MAG: potassium channel family protein [Candidatus Rifleibacteriota bacterium]
MKGLYIVIIGCGQLGATLANKLSKEGHSVVVVDSDLLSFELLNMDFTGFKIEGDAAQPSVLQQAKTGEADAVLALTANENLNLMVALVAKTRFKSNIAIARVYDLAKEKVFKKTGIITLCPTRLVSEHTVELLAKSLQISGEAV